VLSAPALAFGETLAAQDAELAARDRTSKAPYQLSVMLWTILRDLPFEQRLEKVSQAGYRNVELVGEYAQWTDDEFNRATVKRRELGISFDCTAGLKHGVGNPAEREALLAEFRATLPIMERLDCPAMIIMSGNTVSGMSIEAQAQSCAKTLILKRTRSTFSPPLREGSRSSEL
jgi:hydroxypyruvate isomerase